MKSKDKNQVLIELLSAYIDGELTPAQNEKVEKRLAEEPQAREILSQLQYVSEAYRQLLRVEAPGELTDTVMGQLERDYLLDKDEMPVEVGASKPRRVLRYMAAAAAVIAVAGVLATIIYNNVYKPQGPSSEMAPIAEKPLIAKTAEKEAGEDKSSVEKTVVPAIPYGNIQLVLNTEKVTVQKEHLEQLLAEIEITETMAKDISGGKWQCNFLCTTDQFENLFRGLKQADERVDIYLCDEQNHLMVTIRNASVEQARKLAGETNPLVQMAYALRLPAEQIETSSGTEDMIPPDWLELFARGEPEFPGLQPLGPALTEVPAEGPAQPDILSEKVAEKQVPESESVATEAASTFPEGPVWSKPAEKVAVTILVQENPDQLQPSSLDTLKPETIEGDLADPGIESSKEISTATIDENPE